MAFFESLIKTINKVMKIGKLMMAIKVKLLLLLEAMAETIVSNDAKPKLPKVKTIKKRGKSCMILPTNSP
jgi:hypothetical protein